MDDQPNFVSSPFDAIRHEDGNREFWKARELFKLLRYSHWDNFEKVIAKAKIACEYNGHPVEQEFHETTTADIRDVELTRYACYMIVLSSDSAKPIVGLAKDYFAQQTRRQELADADTFAQLSEDEKRLIYRAQLSLYNRKLAQTAHEAGVRTTQEHAGMDSEELGANIFRATQTDAAMKREKVKGKERANATHFTVGRKVREFIINELGGTPPEKLPTPEKSIKQLEQEEQFRLKQKDQPSLFDQPNEESEQ